jgi:hypothetical protein
MDYEIIDKYYKEAVRGIDDEMLIDTGTAWYDHIYEVAIAS